MKANNLLANPRQGVEPVVLCRRHRERRERRQKGAVGAGELWTRREGSRRVGRRS